MSNINLQNELLLAKDAAIIEGTYLTNNKDLK